MTAQMNAPILTSVNDAYQEKPYWVELLGTETRILQGKYKTRILQAGQKDAPALLLLHGTGGHLENYARNIQALAQNFHVIALDFLWHGYSQTENYDPEIIPFLVDQVIDVMDQLHINSAHIEGQSLGGWVAMQLALTHPARVNRLVLTTTMGYRPNENSIAHYVEPNWAANVASSVEVLQNPTYENVRSRMTRILAKPERITDEAILVRQALYQQPALAEVQQKFITEYLSGQIIKKHVMTDALANNIQQPTLVYWGDANRTPPAFGQHIAQQVKNGQFFCAEDTGHWAQFESAITHNRVVTQFLLGKYIEEIEI